MRAIDVVFYLAIFVAVAAVLDAVVSAVRRHIRQRNTPPEPTAEEFALYWQWVRAKDWQANFDQADEVDELRASLIENGLNPEHPHVDDLAERAARRRAQGEELRTDYEGIVMTEGMQRLHDRIESGAAARMAEREANR